MIKKRSFKLKYIIFIKKNEIFLTDGEDEDDGEYDEEDDEESENGDPGLADIYNDGNCLFQYA